MLVRHTLGSAILLVVAMAGAFVSFYFWELTGLLMGAVWGAAVGVGLAVILTRVQGFRSTAIGHFQRSLPAYLVVLITILGMAGNDPQSIDYWKVFYFWALLGLPSAGFIAGDALAVASVRGTTR